MSILLVRGIMRGKRFRVLIWGFKMDGTFVRRGADCSKLSSEPERTNKNRVTPADASYGCAV